MEQCNKRICFKIGAVAVVILSMSGCNTNIPAFDETSYAVLETIDVSSNVGMAYTETESEIEEHEEFEYRREPDIDLPDVGGFDKDEYGNYILTEEALTGQYLPLNSEGQIDYIFYFDSNDNVVNPMPSYYENYPQYFTTNGGWVYGA